jgi:putative transposase
MPRQARAKSESGIYHIMARGINKQLIFEEQEDNYKFIEILGEYKAVSEYKIFAYCLMGNHFHLLLKVEKESLEQIMKKICGKYVYWFNGKYSRTGHLFQDRFKSEPIEDEKYLLTVLRYIHQNPVKADMVKKVAEYEYSSYNEYIFLEEEQLTDIEYVLGIIDKTEFERFNNEPNEDECLETEESKFRLTDEQAKRVIFKVAKCSNASEFQELDIKTRGKRIKKLKEKGLSTRQISRLTGISYGIVRKS